MRTIILWAFALISGLRLSCVGGSDDGLDKCFNEESHPSSCSPPKRTCYQIEHFGTLDYAGNGIYCDFNGTRPHLVRVSKVGQQRYEVMVSSKHKMGDEEGIINSWMLMRVTKSMTSRGDWMPMPIYQAVGTEDGGIPLEGWNGVKRKRKKEEEKTMNFDGGFSYDHEDPILHVSEVTLRDDEVASLWGRQMVEGLTSPGEKSCVASVCGGVAGERVGKDGRCAAFLADAQLAEAGLNNELAAKLYAEAVKCMLGKVEGTSMVPRFERWQIAETYGDVGRMLCRQGLIDEALGEVTKALSYSSVEVQRRGLFMDLGDLFLARGKVDEARKAYNKAKNAVRTRGGMVDAGGFGVRVTKASVGGGLIEVLGGAYERVRGMIILGVDNGEDWKDALGIWVALVRDVGKGVVCGGQEEMMENEFGKFCKKYVRFNHVNGVAVEEGGGSGGEKEEL